MESCALVAPPCCRIMRCAALWIARRKPPMSLSPIMRKPLFSQQRYVSVQSGSKQCCSDPFNSLTYV